MVKVAEVVGMPSSEKMRMVVAIGKAPELDKDLEKKLSKLSKNASIKKYCGVVDEWEKCTILKYKEAEQKADSGKLEPICPLKR